MKSLEILCFNKLKKNDKKQLNEFVIISINNKYYDFIYNCNNINLLINEFPKMNFHQTLFYLSFSKINVIFNTNEINNIIKKVFPQTNFIIFDEQFIDVNGFLKINKTMNLKELILCLDATKSITYKTNNILKSFDINVIKELLLENNNINKIK